MTGPTTGPNRPLWNPLQGGTPEAEHTPESPHNGHGGHGGRRWMMMICCIPMVAIVIVLLTTERRGPALCCGPWAAWP